MSRKTTDRIASLIARLQAVDGLTLELPDAIRVGHDAIGELVVITRELDDRLSALEAIETALIDHHRDLLGLP